MTRWRWCPDVFESGDGHSNNGSLDEQELFVFLLGDRPVGHDD